MATSDMTSAVDRVKLETCPFCGCDDIGTESTATDGSVWCNGCRARITKLHYHPRLDIGQRDAIAAWNRRAPVEAEPATWEHRIRVKRHAGAGWTEWRQGYANLSATAREGLDVEERALYTHPNPSPTSAENAPVGPSAAGEGWRCFHCDETFATEHAARLHFGADESASPACQIKGSEGGLLEALRHAEKDAADAWFAIHNESADASKA